MKNNYLLVILSVLILGLILFVVSALTYTQAPPQDANIGGGLSALAGLFLTALSLVALVVMAVTKVIKTLSRKIK